MKVCETPHITEDEIKEIAVKGINKILKCKKEVIENVEYAINNVLNIEKLTKEKERLERELRLQEDKSKELIENNANRIQDQKKYNKEFAELEKNYSELKEKYDGVVNSIKNLQAHKKELENYVDKLKKQKTIIEEFDESLFAAMIENIIINKEGIIIVTKDGRKIEV